MVTAVGYPSFCYQAHSSSGEEWTEVWFGELHHPRLTTLEPPALGSDLPWCGGRLRTPTLYGCPPFGLPPRPGRDRA
jgi:hypothetical protein